MGLRLRLKEMGYLVCVGGVGCQLLPWRDFWGLHHQLDHIYSIGGHFTGGICYFTNRGCAGGRRWVGGRDTRRKGGTQHLNPALPTLQRCRVPAADKWDTSRRRQEGGPGRWPQRWFPPWTESFRSLVHLTLKQSEDLTRIFQNRSLPAN